MRANTSQMGIGVRPTVVYLLSLKNLQHAFFCKDYHVVMVCHPLYSCVFYNRHILNPINFFWVYFKTLSLKDYILHQKSLYFSSLAIIDFDGVKKFEISGISSYTKNDWTIIIHTYLWINKYHLNILNVFRIVDFASRPISYKPMFLCWRNFFNFYFLETVRGHCKEEQFEYEKYNRRDLLYNNNGMKWNM